MTTESHLRDSIEQAKTTVGSVWPLHSFVTANPLSGFEDQPFHAAVREAGAVFGAEGYPSSAVFRQALDAGQIDRDILRSSLDDHGYDTDIQTTLAVMEQRATDEGNTDSSAHDAVDHLLTKWLAAFLDEGQAEWPMPDREQGFYATFREMAQYDTEIPNRGDIANLPEDPLAAIDQLVAEYPTDQLASLFESNLTALPGWTGFLKQRAGDGGAWQSTYPVTLEGYLAVRLTLADLLDAPLDRANTVETTTDADEVPLAEVWLDAWEASYRTDLVDAVSEASANHAASNVDDGRPDAQFVFCIDTRSEVIRRHIESTGDYDTHGYAGFFGVPMRFNGYDSEVAVDACPPIVGAEHCISDRPDRDAAETKARRDRWQQALDAGHDVLKGVKSNIATAFSFVESAGAGYGAALAARTLAPARVYDTSDAADRAPDNHEFCSPRVDYNPDAVTSLRAGLHLDEKVGYAQTAFELMGWEQFARVVVFTGHASHTTNNPFDSSLDCGACAGNPGGPSARVLAAICNDDNVKAELRDRGFDIPEDTVFVAAEHNTTTDEIDLYDSDVPESHAADVEQIRGDLETARAGAAAERTESMATTESSVVRETERRAADWSETRPEWGLAGNASFVIGPRALTDDLNLDGRAFLHSYDWTTDAEGDALADIIAGPMVVTQWINMQYYFATVDNAVYGSGSKVTHNPVGNVGVYQGNGGDLMTGLPLQSLMAASEDPYHQPLRLSTVIHAPVERVTDILTENAEVTQLLDNDWLSLTVVDPTQDHEAFHYAGDMEWIRSPEPSVDTAAAEEPMVADD